MAWMPSGWGIQAISKDAWHRNVHVFRKRAVAHRGRLVAGGSGGYVFCLTCALSGQLTANCSRRHQLISPMKCLSVARCIRSNFQKLIKNILNLMVARGYAFKSAHAEAV